MQKLEPATLTGQAPVRRFIKECMALGLTRERAKQEYRRLMRQKIFMNDQYQVNVDQIQFPDFYSLTHLSIKRRDKEAIHDWRDMQEIKNQICGLEREAVELYPAESRLVDTVNQYHLWVLPEGVSWPFGFMNRDVSDDGGMTGTKQRSRTNGTESSP